VSRARIAAVLAVAVVASGLTGPAFTGSSTATAARYLDGTLSVPARPLDAGVPGAEEANADWGRRATDVRAESVVVSVPDHGLVRAGGTPVRVGRAKNGATPAKVAVRMLTSEEAGAKGLNGLGFEVTRADGGSGEGTVSVELDYSSIAQSVGGDYATRLRLVQVGECGDATCKPTVTGAENDLVDETLTVDVPVAPRTRDASDASDATTAYTTFGASSGASGSAGNFTATSASPSDQWSVGVGSGAFSYAYDIDVPPAIGGAAPEVSLGYSSQSVDGRTVSQNSQPSMVGEGWGFEPGYIERTFSTCTNGDDLCWSANNSYVMSFGGKSGELVKVPGTTNEWRMRGQDPAWRILSYTGGSNGDNDGEFWVVITPNGTKYWMGLGYEPRNDVTKYTHSAWEVPVYGGSGEPCYNATASASWCQQTYRWNLDFVKDTNDNVTSYFYVKEYNRYARGGLGTQSTQYVRGGYLNWIEYGQRYGTEGLQHPAQVTFTVSNRCKEQVSCPSPTITNAASYPDVPLDQNCTATCTASQSAPTFWTTKQLDQVKTSIANSAGTLEATAIYDLTYKFPGTSDTTSPSLWLDYIQKTGYIGSGTLALPAVSIDGVLLANRVNTGTGVPPMNKYRVSKITNEYGGRINVTYDNPRPCPLAPAYPNFADNPYDCYPAWYQPPTGTGGWVSFHKYVVTKTVVDSSSGTVPAQETNYTYSDAPAWHYSDAVGAPAGSQSWADYRGHAKVTVIKYSDGLASGEVTKHTLFRGMNGDKLTSTTSKSEALTDTHGNSYTDHHYLAGLPLDVSRFMGDGTQLTSTMYRYTAVQTANGPDGWQSHDAQYVQETRKVERVFDLDSTTGGYRDHSVDRTFDATTNAIETFSDNGGGGTDDDTCTKWGYTNDTTTGTSSTTEWLVDAPYRMLSYDGACGSGSTILTAKSEYWYDGNANLTDAPTGHNVTKQIDSVNASATATTERTYDNYGRLTGVISPNEVANGLRRKLTTTYSPAAGYPYTGITMKNVLGHTVTTIPHMALGTQYKVTDENGWTTTTNVDPLGRTISVLRPGDSTSPSLTYEYTVSQSAPMKVKTGERTTGSSYVTSYDFYDGLGRLLEHHEPPANDGGTGRRVTATRYDTHGRVYGISQPFWNSGTFGGDVVNPADSAIPFETRYAYDALGRRTKVAQYASGAWKWTSETQYRGLYERVDSPVSDRADVENYRDVFGRITKVVEHPTAGGTANTTYTYTARGDLATITDDAGRVTTYTYDWMRRRTKSVDPDLGTWTSTFDADGNITSVEDGRLQKLVTEYDALGRRTAVRSGSATGTVLATWGYDDVAVANSTGRLTETARTIGTDSYVTRLAYDLRGRLSSRQVEVPTSEGTLANTYTSSYGYDARDLPTTATMPAIGSLAGETLTTAYNTAGLVTSLTGSETYVASTTYAADGKLAEQQLGSGTTKLVRAYEYDASAARSSRTSATYGATTIEDATVSYDSDSNVRSLTDMVAGSGGVAQRECFRYEDGLRRLTHAYTTGATCAGTASAANPDHAFGADPYDVKYAYDDSGDVTSTTDEMTATTKAYTYGTTGPKHGVVSVGTTHSYEYDGNGNATSRTVDGASETLAWDELNRLLSSTPNAGTATTYRYDADGSRLIRRTGTSATLYLDGAELTTAGDATRYYGDVALRTSTPTGSAVTLLLRNRQGSASIAVDAVTGAVTSRRRYLPYGGDRAASSGMPTTRGFLDKTLDQNGLYQVGARYYEPTIARFVSPDPLSVPFEPQTLAAYTYSGGNPATKTDPTGLVFDNPDGASSDPYEDDTPQTNPDPPKNSSTQANKGPSPVPSATPGPAPVTPDPRDSAGHGISFNLTDTIVRLRNEANGSNAMARNIKEAGERAGKLKCFNAGPLVVCNGTPELPFGIGRGGFTIGNYFFNKNSNCPVPGLYEHEYVHSKQWASIGRDYVRQYFTEEAKAAAIVRLKGGGETAWYNRFEVEAGLEKGCYGTPPPPGPPRTGPTPAPPVPGPSPSPPPTFNGGSW